VITAVQSYVVSKIEFKGLYHLSESSAKELLKFEEKSVVSDREIDKAIKNFYKLNYFNDVWVDYFEQNETLSFNFREKSRISKVSITGFLENDEEQQKDFLGIKKGSFLDKAKIEESKNRILEALDYKGTVDNIVEVKESQLDNGTTELQFIAREGEEIIIRDLELKGAKSFDTKEIQSEMSNREKEGFGWLYGRNSGEMKIKELEIDSHRIKEFYMENGFLDAKVSKPFADIEFSRYGASLKYIIDEGKQYFVKSVNISIDKDDILDINNTLENELILQGGDKFNIKRFRRDMEKIKSLVADKGYAFVDVNPDLDRDSENKVVSISYKIRTGEQVKIRNVLVSGNRLTLDKVVRRDIFLAPGDLYSLTDLKDSKNALGRLGYFDEVNIKEERVSDTEIDLIVSVKEGRSGMIQIGGGYSTYLGLTFDAGISDKNIFGSGMDLGLSLQISNISTNYSLTLFNPRLNDSLYSGSFSVSQNKQEYEDFYTVEDIGFGVSIGKRLLRNLKSSLGYNYSDVEYTNVSEEYDDPFYTEGYIKSAISLSLTYDSTDDYFVPREGFILSDTIEYAGVSGDAKFTKNTLSFNAYLGFLDYLDYDLILRYKSKLRTMNDNGFIPLNEAITMGGIGTVRGYDPFAFPNRDLDEYKYTKALKSFTNSIEASIPISKQAKLRLTGFVDYGWIGVEDFSMEDRGGYGLALEWISPMAPIQFVFSRTFNDEITDKTSSFEFTMGRRF
jgi:outer membrane protein insertion porin family